MAHLITEPSFASDPDRTLPPKGPGDLCTIAVDLVPVRPGGANGGHKIFTLELLRRLQSRDDLHFVFLTASDSHREIRRLAMPDDMLICVLDVGGQPYSPNPACPTPEYHLPDAPEDLCFRIGVDLVYAPFGDSRFSSTGLPYVTMVADLLHRDYPMSLSPEEIAHREDYLSRSLRQASAVQCVSHYTRERLRDLYAIEGNRLFVSYEPLQERLPDPEEIARQNPKHQEPYFFYPANYWVHKNHETLLVAYALYREMAHPDAWDLVLSGHPDSRTDRLRSLAESLGIEQSVRFSGYVHETQMPALWMNAGALVFPSLHEGFGIPLVEAMHYGLPIITSGEGSTREIVGDAGIIANCRRPRELALALLEVSRDPDLRKSLIDQGRKRLVLFDFASETRRLGDLLYRIAQTERTNLPSPSSEGLRMVTPADAAAWTFEVNLAAELGADTIRVSLGGLPWGYFDQDDCRKRQFEFRAVPMGRTLELAFCFSSDSGALSGSGIQPVESVWCRSDRGHRMLLRQFEPC